MAVNPRGHYWKLDMYINREAVCLLSLVVRLFSWKVWATVYLV